LSLEQWVPQCRLIYDKFDVMKHANEAVSEVRRAEFLRKGGAARELIKGKHWLLLTHLNTNKKRQLNQGAMLRYLQKLDRPVALAAAQALGEAGADVAESSGRNHDLTRNSPAPGIVPHTVSTESAETCLACRRGTCARLDRRTTASSTREANIQSSAARSDPSEFNNPFSFTRDR